jgi:transcriptional regulator EpsA
MSALENAVLVEKALDRLDRVNSNKAYLLWTREHFAQIFPHGCSIFCLGRIYKNGVSAVRLLPSENFPPTYLDALKQANGLYFSEAIQSWLETDDVLLLDAKTIGRHPNKKWRENFKRSGLENIASHGVFDVSRQFATYFSFHQMPEPLEIRRRQLLKLFVPHMHVVLLRVLHKTRTHPAALNSNRKLTPREHEVLRWVCKGKTSTEIASILGVKPNTTRNQIQNILVKLRVNTRAQAAAKAVREGLVIPE